MTAARCELVLHTSLPSAGWIARCYAEWQTRHPFRSNPGGVPANRCNRTAETNQMHRPSVYNYILQDSEARNGKWERPWQL